MNTYAEILSYPCECGALITIVDMVWPETCYNCHRPLIEKEGEGREGV